MDNEIRHPYVGLPDYQFWNKEPGILDASQFDPITQTPFQISKSENVITAGSCFAQHVARYLANNGFNHLITENAHPLFDQEIAFKHNYGIFSARYGNVYTTRQLKQLLQRAFGEFQPKQNSWKAKGTSFIDPFRPHIQPNGFCSESELENDKTTHFKCVREAFEKADVFVFTLGLTEGWIDPHDGAVFPIAPGISGGIYSDKTAKYKNFNVTETILDLEFSLNYIRLINPSCKFIITVSPVPLNATFENKHVFVSTTYSKSVLRVAAEEVTRNNENTTYFPSYEIITSPYAKGAYFAPDCRSVTPAGVEAVMGVFLSNFSATDATTPVINEDSIQKEVAKHLSDMASALDVLCDEEAINNRDY